MSTTPITKEQDQFICDWFDNLDADYIRQLQELNDDYDLTPRRAYHLVFGDLSGVCTCKACLLPGQKDPGASLAAPAQVFQVEGTRTGAASMTQQQQDQLFPSVDPRSRLEQLRLEFEVRQRLFPKCPFDIWVPVPVSSGRLVAKVSVSLYDSSSSSDDEHLTICAVALWGAIERIGDEQAKRDKVFAEIKRSASDE